MNTSRLQTRPRGVHGDGWHLVSRDEARRVFRFWSYWLLYRPGLLKLETIGGAAYRYRWLWQHGSGVPSLGQVPARDRGRVVLQPSHKR